MNYKIGDKVTLAPTTPLIITNIDDKLLRIEVKSPDNDICFWTSPDHLTPTLRPESTSIPPHKSPQIGDIVVTKPTAKSEYDSPIGDRIGIIYDHAYSRGCYRIEWIYDILAHRTLENFQNVVHPKQFSHIHTPSSPSKNSVPQLGDIVIADPGARSVGGVDISNLIGYAIDIDDSVYVEWLTPTIEHWTKKCSEF
jgi:hypothetical protein